VALGAAHHVPAEHHARDQGEQERPQSAAFVVLAEADRFRRQARCRLWKQDGDDEGGKRRRVSNRLQSPRSAQVDLKSVLHGRPSWQAAERQKPSTRPIVIAIIAPLPERGQLASRTGRRSRRPVLNLLECPSVVAPCAR
jgi:hypothetical protein